MNKRNCKHKLSDVLLLVILARACGCETRKDIVPTLRPNDEWKSEWELAHGRLYQRRCRVYSDISGIKALEKFLNVKAVVTIDTHTIEKNSGTEQNQTRYYITSLEEGAQTLDRISRMHWGIENNLHWTLEARMSQNHTKRKETKSARNLDSIQKLVYIIHTIASKKHLPEAIRKRKILSAFHLDGLYASHWIFFPTFATKNK